MGRYDHDRISTFIRIALLGGQDYFRMLKSIIGQKLPDDAFHFINVFRSYRFSFVSAHSLAAVCRFSDYASERFLVSAVRFL